MRPSCNFQFSRMILLQIYHNFFDYNQPPTFQNCLFTISFSKIIKCLMFLLKWKLINTSVEFENFNFIKIRFVLTKILFLNFLIYFSGWLKNTALFLCNKNRFKIYRYFLTIHTDYYFETYSGRRYRLLIPWHTLLFHKTRTNNI